MVHVAERSHAVSEARRWRTPDLTRDIDAGAYLETLFVSAVTSVLLTRLYLQMAGFPQIGSGGLHLAHLLWGGFLMLIALILLLASLGKRLKHVSAAVGGLGFGLFVDEIGKFVTSDNNYFFQPAVALIYLIMVVLFLLARAIERRQPSAMELLVNAADHVREVVLDGATRAEVARGLDLLARSGAVGPLAEHIRALLESTETELEAGPSRFRRLAEWVWRVYDRLLQTMWFRRAVILVFVSQAVLGVLAAATLAALAAMLLPATWDTWLHGEHPRVEASLGAASVSTSLISLLLVMVGVFYLRRARVVAYRWFERSLLVGILITQVTLFWQDQFAALGGLFWNLVLLTVVRSMIALEHARAYPRWTSTMPSATATSPAMSPGPIDSPRNSAPNASPKIGVKK